MPDMVRLVFLALILQLFVQNAIAEQSKQPTSCRLNSYGTKLMMELYNILNNRETDMFQQGARIRRNYHTFEIQEEPRYLSIDEIANGEMSDVVYLMRPIDDGSGRNMSRLKLEFSSPQIDLQARVLSAKLKLFQNKEHYQVKDDFYVILVYTRQRFDGKDYFIRAGYTITAADYSGWIAVDISEVFKAWVRNKTQIYELHVSAHPYNFAWAIVDPRSIGIQFQHGHLQNEPFILSFIRTDSEEHLRFPRNVDTDPIELDVEPAGSMCEMVSLTVQFKELHMDTVVLAPQEYLTGVCTGGCNFPIKFPVEASAHSIVQSLMHIKYPDEFPSPRCAPRESGNMAVLFQYGANTLYKVFPRILVKSCACL
ncbi:bone morphogenetic protein 7 [Dendroctonus ponderosae]